MKNKIEYKNHKIEFIGMRGPFTDYNGKPIPKVIIDKNDFSKIRKKYNIKKEEYDEMINCTGVWIINKRINAKSFILTSTNGTPKMIVISEMFLKGLLKKYK